MHTDVNEDSTHTQCPHPLNVCQCVLWVFFYRQSPGGRSDGFSLWAVGGRVQAVGSLFGRGGVADLGEVTGRYRVHQWAGQTGAKELGLHSGG